MRVVMEKWDGVGVELIESRVIKKWGRVGVRWSESRVVE